VIFVATRHMCTLSQLCTREKLQRFSAIRSAIIKITKYQYSIYIIHVHRFVNKFSLHNTTGSFFHGVETQHVYMVRNIIIIIIICSQRVSLRQIVHRQCITEVRSTKPVRYNTNAHDDALYNNFKILALQDD